MAAFGVRAAGVLLGMLVFGALFHCIICEFSASHRSDNTLDGDALMAQGEYERAGEAYLLEMTSSEHPSGFNLQDTFVKYLQAYEALDRPLAGYLKIAKLYMQQGDFKSAQRFIANAVAISDAKYQDVEPPWDENKDAAEANHLAYMLLGDAPAALARLHVAVQLDPTNSAYNYEWGTKLFAKGMHEDALSFFETSYKSNNDMWISFATAVYLRTRVRLAQI